jgi:hypothetical protein
MHKGTTVPASLALGAVRRDPQEEAVGVERLDIQQLRHPQPQCLDQRYLRHHQARRHQRLDRLVPGRLSPRAGAICKRVTIPGHILDIVYRRHPIAPPPGLTEKRCVVILILDTRPPQSKGILSTNPVRNVTVSQVGAKPA